MKITIKSIWKVTLFFWALVRVNSKCDEGDDKFCAMCDNSNCILCYHSFPKDGACTAPTTQIENCLQYSEESTCSKCKEQYFLNDNKCTRGTIDWCLHYESEKSCSACDTILLKDDKTCDFTTICSQKGCLSCENKESVQQCIQCQKGYIKKLQANSDFLCEAESDTTKGVAVQNESGSSECKYGHYVSSKKGESLVCTVSDAYESNVESTCFFHIFWIGLFFSFRI